MTKKNSNIVASAAGGRPVDFFLFFLFFFLRARHEWLLLGDGTGPPRASRLAVADGVANSQGPLCVRRSTPVVTAWVGGWCCVCRTAVGKRENCESRGEVYAGFMLVRLSPGYGVYIHGVYFPPPPWCCAAPSPSKVDRKKAKSARKLKRRD